MRRNKRLRVIFTFSILLVLSSLVLAEEGDRVFHATAIEYTDREEIKDDIKAAVRDAVQERRQEIRELEQEHQEAIDDIQALGGKRSYNYHLEYAERRIPLLVEEEIITDEEGQEIVQRWIMHERVKMKTHLRLKQVSDEGRLRVELSDGQEIDVQILPDEVDSIARQQFKTGDLSMELIEQSGGINKKQLVYEVKTQKDARFLGLINTKVDMNAKIDPQTGEILQVKKPWWSFLVAGEEDSDGTEELL